METRKRRFGRQPKPETDLHRNVVNVWLTDDELADLERKRGKMRRGAYLRACYLNRVPPLIPELNREAWTELSRAASNLNQIAKALHEEVPDIENVRQSLDAFRRALIGAKP